MGFTPVLQDQPSFGVVQLVCQALQGVLLEYQFQPQVQLITDWVYHAVLLDVPGVDQEVLPPFVVKQEDQQEVVEGLSSCVSSMKKIQPSLVRSSPPLGPYQCSCSSWRACQCPRSTSSLCCGEGRSA